METLLPIIYIVWFLIACIYIFKPKLLWKLKMPLHRYGFFANWSMYVPKGANARKTYHLMYRDRNEKGEVKDWVEFEYPEWKPYLFLFNLRSRMNSVFSKCVSILIKINQKEGKRLDDDPRFVYLCQVICCIRPKELGCSRQIRLEYHTIDGTRLLVSESEFIPLK